jgi:hypothetical protein
VTTPNLQAFTALQILNAAAQELGVLAGGEQLQPTDQAWCFQKMMRLLDTYNAKRTMVYANTFTSFALQAGLAPHTIGPTGTFPLAQRPTEIPSIGLQLNNSAPQTVEIPLYRMTKEEWAAEQVKPLTSDIPTKYYYEPDWPNGSIYFWPVPTAVNNVLLQQRTVFVQPTAYNTSISLPPGYLNMLCYDLAKEIAPSFEAAWSESLESLRMGAKNAVLGNNIQSPLGSTRDAGMPGGRDSGTFNYVTGTISQ